MTGGVDGDVVKTTTFEKVTRVDGVYAEKGLGRGD